MSTEERVFELIRQQAGIEGAMSADQSFSADYGFDLLDNVEMLMAIEDEFGIEISAWAAQEIGTVAEAIALVDRLVGEQA